MAISIEVKGVEALTATLSKLVSEYGPQPQCNVIVGYSADYAVHVHENLEAYHPNGQAKFLEQPATENVQIIGQIVERALTTGADLEQALLAGGLYLQAESQRLVPVDTGNLKNSAFTTVES